MADRNDDWCILRTSPGRTLALADALADAGFAVWTPAEVRVHRPARTRKQVELRAPILPGFVFAPMQRLRELVTLSHQPALNYRVWDKELRRMVEKGRPHFTVFRDGFSVGRASDASLAGLRAFEARLMSATERRRKADAQRGPAPRFHAGEAVLVTGGAFEGLTLTVVKPNDGKLVKVSYPGWTMPLEISAWSLQEMRQAA